MGQNNTTKATRNFGMRKLNVITKFFGTGQNNHGKRLVVTCFGYLGNPL